MTQPRVYSSVGVPSADSLRVLREFLEAEDPGEKALQHLLESHPKLLGLFGFSCFASEVPLYKRDNNGKVFLDKRKRDRADILPATEGQVLLSDGTPLLITNVMELKRSGANIAERDSGIRATDDVRKAISQANEYSRHLREVDANRKMIDGLGWSLGTPRLHLVMGNSQEFAGRPSQLEAIRGDLALQGVALRTVDELLSLGERMVVTPDVGIHGPQAFAAQDRFLLQVASGVSRSVVDRIIRAQSEPESIRGMTPREFEETVAELLASNGMVVDLTPQSRDGGYDIFGRTPKDPATGTRHAWIVECKRFSEHRKVGVEQVRQLFAAKLISMPDANMMLATTSSFTTGAKQWEADRHDMVLRDYEGILEWVGQYKPLPNGKLYSRENRL